MRHQVSPRSFLVLWHLGLIEFTSGLVVLLSSNLVGLSCWYNWWFYCLPAIDAGVFILTVYRRLTHCAQLPCDEIGTYLICFYRATESHSFAEYLVSWLYALRHFHLIYLWPMFSPQQLCSLHRAYWVSLVVMSNGARLTGIWSY